MWDRLLTDCHVATMIAAPGNPLGIVRNAAIGIDGGKVVRVGKRTELAGFQAREVTALGGAWVTPGLVDCHTHLVFAGTRANEHAMRRAGASYEAIAKAGGGIVSTVAAVRSAKPDALVEQSRRRLHALMAGGVTTVEIKSGYGLDTATEVKLLEAARALGTGEPVRIVPTLLAAHALPADARDGAARAEYIDMIVREMIPTVAKAKLATSVDAFCETIAFTPEEVEKVFTAARAHGLPVRLHAEQLSNQKGAELAARYKALSADHLEHLDAAGAKALAAAGTIAVLLPGAFYALNEKAKPPVDVLRKEGVAIAIATDCNPGTSPLLNPQLAMNMAATLFGLTPEEALQGMTVNAARALGLAHEVGTVAAGKAADLCAWGVENLNELAYWVGMPGPDRRIFGGVDR
jgi:imidazolonepropionase